MDEKLKKIADAMGVSVDDARYIFDSVGPISAVEIVRGLAIDHEIERAIEEAAPTEWWREDDESWPG